MPASRRHDARERALALLYEAQAKGLTPAEVIAALPVPPDTYAGELVQGVGQHQRELDELIGAHARGWTVERMPVVDRTVLRIAVFELVYRDDVPTAVVIDEAVDLAKEFSTDDSGRFVNGVLGPIARAVRPDATPAPIAVVIVDVDGVVRHWHAHETDAHEDRLGVPRGAFGRAAFEPDLLQRAMTGGLTDDAWRQQVGEALAASHGVDAAEATAAWADIGWRVDDEVLEVLGAARAAGCRVAFFSNATDRLEDDLRKSGLFEAVDVVLNSWRLGVAKPAVDAFEAAAAALDVEPARCVFVDDRVENVEGALAAGMRAELFVDAERLRELLVREGVLS